MRVEPPRHVAENGLVERAPIAAVYEQSHGAQILGRPEHIHAVARPCAIGEIVFASCRTPEVRCIMLPLSDDSWMLGHAFPHVVFVLKVHVFSRQPLPSTGRANALAPLG